MYLIEQLQFRDRIYYFSWTQSIIFHNKVTMREQFNVSWDVYCSSIPRMSVWTYLRTYGALGTAVFLCSSKYAITYFPISFFPQSRVSFSHMCHCNLMNRPLWQTLLMLKKKKKRKGKKLLEERDQSLSYWLAVSSPGFLSLLYKTKIWHS